MSTKMKRAAFDSSFSESYEDARARFKHQTLLQDFLELQQETKAQRNKLMALKQKELTLKAEVSFLRRRRDFLLKNKSTIPQERFFAKPKPTHLVKSKKEKICVGKAATLCNSGKKKALTLVFDLNLENDSLGVNGNGAIRGSNLNQRVRINGLMADPFLDLNKKDCTFRGQEPVGQTRASGIDLNQVSREEEESQDGCEPLEDRTHGLIGNGVDELADVKSLYRNVGVGSVSGSGSTSRSGKRKISWQDPVALRV